jgi:suppressor for copper-sensitivity B
MVDVTAEWCLNCKYNLKFVFDSDAVAAKVAELGVVPLVADWTAPEADIEAFINELAPGASIPLWAVFPAGRPNEPIVHLGILTKDEVIETLEKAGPSKTGGKAVANAGAAGG